MVESFFDFVKTIFLPLNFFLIYSDGSKLLGRVL